MPNTGKSAAKSLRVLVVVSDTEVNVALREDLAHGLGEAGCLLVDVVAAGLAVIDRIEQTQPDVIVIEAESDWRDALEHVCVATQHAPRPIVLFTENPDTADARHAIAAGVSAYVVAGLAAERVRPVIEVAMARFDIEQSMRAELTDAREKLAERKEIERAKGLLMEKLALTEDDAFRKLRRLAMDRKETLRAAARRVIDAAQLFG